MEEILVKLADILDMSVDGVLKAYPILRNQFVNSYLWSQLNSVAFGFTILAGMVALRCNIEFFTSTDDKKTIKNAIISLIVFSILIIARVFITNKIVQLAPDLLFLESLSYL